MSTLYRAFCEAAPYLSAIAESRRLAAAQARFESPEDDGPSECEDCSGRGTFVHGRHDYSCQNCDGLGWIDADGEPCKSPDEQREEALAEARADREFA